MRKQLKTAKTEENGQKKSAKQRHPRLRKIRRFCYLLAILCVLLILSGNSYIIHAGRKSILSEQQACLQTADCILVLGCAVKGNTPSLMLQDRLNTAVSLYKNGVTKKIIMSGDHREDNYNEVGVMKAYAIQHGVEANDIYMDPEGYCTYDSLYLAKEKFGCKNIIIVTQVYHLYRALYIANRLGINAYGLDAGGNHYRGQSLREIREIAARNKEILNLAFRSKPVYQGKTYSLTQGGDTTNDAAFEKLLNEFS